MTDDPNAALKRQAAEAAAALVTDGMAVGLGTGSTAYFAIANLIARVKQGLRITAIPTSERSATQAREGGIELVELTETTRLDLTIDGADSVAAGSLDLVKGLGGALLREKIVAAASAKLLIVVDGGKLVDKLGMNAPIPVEVVPFGWRRVAGQMAELGARPVLRLDPGGSLFHTDGGNFILDCHMPPIDDPAALDSALQSIVGVVETGLFISRTTTVFVADPAGVRTLTP
ncbi:ribose-5-phosphate isomerase RpiA [Acidisphaera sp. L21]|jgi:ribose 5-phosphate isomerase A|uniref:ribose-5-phosphate isomerase RpiA n=1 Tax=Acidisphaera sp. L21 TaxID=1641851 RepID=UPI00131D0577|nr:ribose-5-phosphate isomerase RpiA [Acidisphaera sp. L21]